MAHFCDASMSAIRLDVEIKTRLTKNEYPGESLFARAVRSNTLVRRRMRRGLANRITMASILQKGLTKETVSSNPANTRLTRKRALCCESNKPLFRTYQTANPADGVGDNHAWIPARGRRLQFSGAPVLHLG